MNIKLAEKVLRQITEHPETHDQNYWGRAGGECGTVYCIAGWTCVLNGDTPIWGLRNPYGVRSASVVRVETDTGTVRETIPLRAIVLLGISEKDSDSLLYNTSNDEAIDFLRELIADAREEAGNGYQEGR